MKKIFFLILILIFGGRVSLFTNAKVCCEIAGEVKTKPGKVTVEWEEKQLRICPPGIFGTSACKYPDLQTIIQKFIDFILKVAPLTLVILLILGGFLYMLSVFKPDLISLGHRYIQWAVYGYIILLLITLVFTFIRAIFGGPKL